jgi:hypothetical protein
MGTFVRRLVVLTVVWLLATAALTYAASRRVAAGPTLPTTTATTTTAAEQTVVVPDVLDQPYVFAEGTLSDAGFSWRVEGSVKGFAANSVATQTPAAGTLVRDTGSPLIVLHLTHGKGVSDAGDAQNTSPVGGTAVVLAGRTVAASAVAVTPKVKTKAKAKAPVAKKAVTKKVATKKTAAKTPKKRWPQNRPPAFTVAGARREPLDEMPLPDRAELLMRYVQAHRTPTDAVVSYWLYQHAWLVAGARMGWWQGALALQKLADVDRQVWQEWGIGERSAEVARAALTYVDAHAK